MPIPGDGNITGNEYSTGAVVNKNLLILDGSDSVQRYKRQVKAISRPGADGVDFQVLGLQAKRFVVKTFRDVQLEDGARTMEASFDALKGTLVAYKDENEFVWTSVFVFDHTCERRRLPFSLGYYAPAGIAWGLFSSWIMQLTQTDPPQ